MSAYIFVVSAVVCCKGQFSFHVMVTYIGLFRTIESRSEHSNIELCCRVVVVNCVLLFFTACSKRFFSR